MRGQPGRDDFHGPQRFELSGHPEHANLVFYGEPVSRLHFHDGNPVADQVIKASQGCGHQCLKAGSAGRFDRGVYAAAASGNLFIAHPLKTLFEFLRAIAAEDQMRVTINKRRRHESALQGLLCHFASFAWDRARADDPFDQAVALENRGILDQSVTRPTGLHSGNSAIGEQGGSCHRSCLMAATYLYVHT